MNTIDHQPIAKKPDTLKVHIETWGCQMNVVDSESMLSVLNKADYEQAHSAQDADLIVLNTCHIREKAKHKVLSRLGELREMKAANPSLKIAVAGCVAQAEGKKLLKTAPYIDVLFGPGKISSLPNLLKQKNETPLAPAIALGFDRHKEEETTDIEVREHPATGKNSTSRYLNITQGCDNFCTFCVVPFTRGREVSKRPEEVTSECKQLISYGAKEITLLGQNVNSYGNDLIKNGSSSSQDHRPFVSLLRDLSQIEGLQRLRFTTSNPHDFTKELSNLFFEHEVLGRYLHLPVQSGSNEILERMKRKVTAEDYLKKIQWLRDADPEFAISTDLIVGFPGETEEQFEETVDLVKRVRFSFIFSFMYSPRKNTAAARFKEQLTEEDKRVRLHKLNKCQEKITAEWNEAEIGRVRDVLFLYESRKRPGQFYGRTTHFRPVRIESKHDLVGKSLPVKILEANPTAMLGALV